MKAVVQIIRSLVGILFIFSGLVKLNDPMGFSFKLEEYFGADVLNLEFLIPYALTFAVVIVIFEVVLGVALLLGYRIKLTIWALVLMILFFTFLTFYSAYFNKVTDCGCFGDAIPLTPWQSFGKDVILTILIAILFFFQKYIQPVFGVKANIVILMLSIAICSFIANQVLNHLPYLDFRAYKVGTKIEDGMKSAEELGLEAPVFETFFTLQNEAGEQRIVSGTQYVEDKWYEKKDWSILSDKTESVKIKEGYEPPIHDFSINLEEGDMTYEILSEPLSVWVISYDINKVDHQGLRRMADLAWKLEDAGIPVYGMSGSPTSVVDPIAHETNAPFPWAEMDQTALKTIVRSNPGMVVVKDGVIVGKYHFNDTPHEDVITSQR